jgi:transcriptional regulator with XRE-family HTH domain
MMTVDRRSNVNTDKKRRAMMRAVRKKLKLKQSELAVLAGVSVETVARFERGKHVSLTTQDRVNGAIIRMAAKKNPEAFKKAAEPALKEAARWEKVLSLEPGSKVALELERLNGKSLAELKVVAETLAPFLRGAANIALSLTE